VLAGENRYQLLDVADLCEVIELGLRREPAIANDTFNVGARQFGTMRENFQAVLDRAGHGRKVVALPAAPAVFACGCSAPRLLAALRVDLRDGGDGELRVDGALERRLGYVPRRSNRAALIANYDWYLAHRDELQGAAERRTACRGRRLPSMGEEVLLSPPAGAASGGLAPSAPSRAGGRLDGTLIRTDSLLESVFVLAKEHPWLLLSLPAWLAQGRAS